MDAMFCFQCEQAANGSGCTTVGICGKQPEVAALQDLLVYGLKGLSFWAHQARLLGARDQALNLLTVEGLFATVTNVNFDPAELEALVRRCAVLRRRARELFEKANGGPYSGPLPAAAKDGRLPQGREALVAAGGRQGVKDSSRDADLNSARELLVYGCKGLAAYTDHAHILGYDDACFYAFLHKALAATLDERLGLEDFIQLALECGRVNIDCMGMLNRAHMETYGAPEPTWVDLGSRAGKAILVSGHDLKMLEELLKQSAGKGITIYTHGEMLPAHGYPGLKKYSHLAGNYGGAWQDQVKELAQFPGAIIFNTNCIQRPAESYRGRLFTWGLVRWPGVNHVSGWDFSAVLAKALECPTLPEAPGQKILTGCGHSAVLGLAEPLLAAIRTGEIRHLFLIGGCDGAKPGRNYFAEFAEQAPKDTLILTLACGKYRFNKGDFGRIGDIPRLLDVGQCNDAYSAIRIARELAAAMNCELNQLPLSLLLSWYEQKAVAILLSLLHLGMRNIRLGPSLPAFLTPTLWNLLVDNYALAPTGTAREDLRQILG